MDRSDLEELFGRIMPVTIRRMFGGHGVYADGRIFAVEVDGEVMLKGDAETKPAYEAAGMRQWVYEMKGRAGAMPYWRIPDVCFEDEAELRRLAAMALAAGARHEAAKTAASAAAAGRKSAGGKSAVRKSARRKTAARAAPRKR